jgi:hypothetical protein
MKTSDLETPEASECALPVVDSFQSLQTNFTTGEEYALSLERTAKALAAENRRLGCQITHLTSENQRLRGATEQMRTELLVFNKLLEPLHAIAELECRQRRYHKQEMAGLNHEPVTECRHHEDELAGLSIQLVEVKARLASLHSSRCWRVTAPLRWYDDLQRGVVKWLHKRLGGGD